MSNVLCQQQAEKAPPLFRLEDCSASSAGQSSETATATATVTAPSSEKQPQQGKENPSPPAAEEEVAPLGVKRSQSHPLSRVKEVISRIEDRDFLRVTLAMTAQILELSRCSSDTHAQQHSE